MPRTVRVVLAHWGVAYLTEGQLTLYNLMGDAGKNVVTKKSVHYLSSIPELIKQLHDLSRRESPARPATHSKSSGSKQHA